MGTKNEPLIYLVDDDQLYVRTLERYLAEGLKKKAMIRSFRTGEELMKDLPANKPDVIVMDHMLNSEQPFAMDGLLAMQKVKQIYPDVRVVMLSGQDKMEVAINSLKSGADDYVVKNDNAFLRIRNVIRNLMENRAKNRRKELNQMLVGLAFFILAGTLLGVVVRSLYW